MSLSAQKSVWRLLPGSISRTARWDGGETVEFGNVLNQDQL